MISHTNIILGKYAKIQKYKTNGHKTIDAGTEMMNNMPNRIIFDNNKDTQKSKEKETERSKHHLYNGKRALRIQRKYNSHPMMLLFIFILCSAKKTNYTQIKIHWKANVVLFIWLKCTHMKRTTNPRDGDVSSASFSNSIFHASVFP